MWRFLLMSFLVIALASFTAWTFYKLNQTRTVISVTDNSEPDMFIENVSAVIMNKEGNPALKLETPKMIHHAHDDTINVDTPHVTLFRDSPEPWYIDAKFGKTVQGVTEITFWENVVIHHVADKNNPNTQMTTQSLTIIPNKKIAKTDMPILITQPCYTIRAIGMLANLNEGTIKLLSKAEEEYVPIS